MFKEKYLIFEEKEPPSQFSEHKKPEKKESENPDERKGYGQDIAESLVEERPIEQKVEEVLQQLYGLFTNRDVPIFEKSAHMSQKIATIAEIFFGDKTRTFLTERIKAGYEFGGYGYGGAMLYWWKPEESSTSIEVNPLFLEPEIFYLLSPKMKELVKKCQLEVLQNEINIEFVKIFNALLKSNIVLRTFDLQRFRNSDFGNDVFAVVEAGKNVPGGQGYDERVTEKGVSFMASDFLKTKEWEDVHLKLEDYDQNLNYKALSPRPQEVVMNFPEPQVEEETSDEKPPEGSPPYRPTDEELRVHREEIKRYKLRMSELAKEAPDLAKIHENVEKFIDEAEDIAKENANEGNPRGDTFRKLENLSSHVLPEGNSYKESRWYSEDDLHKEYRENFEKAVYAHIELFYP